MSWLAGRVLVGLCRASPAPGANGVVERGREEVFRAQQLLVALWMLAARSRDRVTHLGRSRESQKNKHGRPGEEKRVLANRRKDFEEVRRVQVRLMLLQHSLEKYSCPGYISNQEPEKWMEGIHFSNLQPQILL